MTKVKSLVSNASDAMNMAMIDFKNRLAVATADKREALDTTQIGAAVIGIVVCAVILIIFVGASGDGSDSNSILGIFSAKIKELVTGMFSKANVG